LDAESIKFRNDETNNDLTIPRNRIRHQLLPYLRENFTQGISAVLAREAHVARQDADWLDDAADQASARVVETRENVVTLDARELLALPPALAWRVVRRALGTLARERFISLDHVEAVMGLTAFGNKRSVSLPGQRAEMVNGSVHLEPADVVMTAEPVEFSYMLSVPGEVLVEESGRRIKATLGKVPDRSGLCNRSELVAVDAERMVGPMTVRGRRPGDRLRPLGSPGKRSLQDLFVDRKVSRASRDQVPIVTDSDGRIVWIVGLTVAHQFRVTERTQSVIFLESKKLGVEE
jgi:tRNA(Ile)-lysidine synthase